MKKAFSFRFIVVLILFAVLIGVLMYQLQKPKVLLYGPTPKPSMLEKFSFIEPTNYKDYDALYKRVDEIICSDSIPVVELHNKRTFKYIPFYLNRCSFGGGVVDFKMRNVLEITDGSCYHGPTEPVDSLAYLLDQFINNPEEKEYFSQHPLKSLIFISYREKGVEEFVRFLDRLTVASDKAGVSAFLHLELMENSFFRPPPPPPLNN